MSDVRSSVHAQNVTLPLDDAFEVADGSLPDDGSFALRMHHVASFVPVGDDEWERLRGLLAEQGLGFDYTLVIPNRVRAGYIDTTAELGHFLEVCQLQAEDTELFSRLAQQAD